MSNKGTILIVGALPNSLVNFRGPLIREMLAKGWRVVGSCCGSHEPTEETLAEWGALYVPNRISRGGINPIADILTFLHLVRLIRRIRPDKVLTYTIKPVVYGSLAARCCGVSSRYAMIEGLGRSFMPRESFLHGLTTWVARFLYKISLPANDRVFFLNPDDFNQFIDQRFVSRRRAAVLDGIGIDLDAFRSAETPRTQTVSYLLIARLIRDKGVIDYLEAGRLLRSTSSNASLVLVGGYDANPASLKPNDLEPYIRDGIVDFKGLQADVIPVLRECSVYVLPSYYREGTPRTILEAMAIGRPIITTDAPGCRETVRPMRLEQREEIGALFNAGEYDERGWLRIGKLMVGANGILIPVRDVQTLVEAMRMFVDHPELIPVMGRESRRYAEERYDVHKVNEVMLREMGIT